MPATPAEFKGLLLGAIEDDNPVLMLEHRWLHYVTGEVPEGFTSIPIAGPRLAREGKDLTIVASSYTVLEALRAADALAESGCEAEVFDLRVLRPLDFAAILASVRRTGHLITVDTGFRMGGLGAELAAEITEQAFTELKQAPRRIGLPDHPTPSSRALAAGYYPGSVDIVDTVEDLLGLDSAAAEGARQACIAARQGVAIDKPDPAFKGPF
jgi:pyruvate dehydrogenase E1 component beta subunit